MDHQRYISVATAEGTRYGALFAFLPGRPLGHNFGKQNVNMHRLGEMAARVHTIADELKQPVQRWTMDFDAIVTQFLDAAPSVLGHREKDLAYLTKLAARLESVILDQPDGALGFGLCHGDLHTHNVMLQPDGDLAIFDLTGAATAGALTTSPLSGGLCPATPKATHHGEPFCMATVR